MITNLLESILFLPMVFGSTNGTEYIQPVILDPPAIIEVAETDPVTITTPVILDALGQAVTPQDDYDYFLYEECDIWVNDVQIDCFSTTAIYSHTSTLRQITAYTPTVPITETYTNMIDDGFQSLHHDNNSILAVKVTSSYQYVYLLIAHGHLFKISVATNVESESHMYQLMDALVERFSYYQ